MTCLSKRPWVAGVLVAGSLLASSCGDEQARAAPPASSVDELQDHGGEFCPRALPTAPRETYGFGTDHSAQMAPSLWAPQEAWICQYGSKDLAPTSGNGSWLEWVRQGEPRRLDARELEAFAAALKDLQPPPKGGYACTDDLGPRYLVSYVYENDLTGVVIDDFGCREIRLTDEPFETVPGDADQPGTVAGVLFGPSGLLSDLGE